MEKIPRLSLPVPHPPGIVLIGCVCEECSDINERNKALKRDLKEAKARALAAVQEK